MSIRKSIFRGSRRNVQYRPHRQRRSVPQRRGLKEVPGSRTIISPGQIILKLTVEGADASILDVLRSALPDIRAALLDGHRLDINLVEASVATQEVGVWRSPPERFRELTPRQREILDLLATGLSNKEIGRKLALSHFTIRNHISQIMRLLDVSNRHEAVAALALLEHQSSADIESPQIRN